MLKRFIKLPDHSSDKVEPDLNSTHLPTGALMFKLSDAFLRINSPLYFPNNQDMGNGERYG